MVKKSKAAKSFVQKHKVNKAQSRFSAEASSGHSARLLFLSLKLSHSLGFLLRVQQVKLDDRAGALGGFLFLIGSLGYVSLRLLHIVLPLMHLVFIICARDGREFSLKAHSDLPIQARYTPVPGSRLGTRMYLNSC